MEAWPLGHVDALTALPLGILGLSGPWEIMIILLVVLLLFGNKLPGMARNLGRSFIEFKKGVKGQGEGGDKAIPAGSEPSQVSESRSVARSLTLRIGGRVLGSRGPLSSGPISTPWTPRAFR